MLILGGLWAAFLGYGLMYTGVAKLSGDTTCTIGRALRGQCTLGNAGHGGPAFVSMSSAQAAAAARARQLSAVSPVPMWATA